MYTKQMIFGLNSKIHRLGKIILFSLKNVSVEATNNGYLITQMIFMTTPLLKFG